MNTVLVTNGQLRKSLAAVRSLGQRGIRVVVCETTACNPSRFSKYCAAFEKNPDPSREAERFYKWLLEMVKKYQLTTIFPMDEDVMEIVIANYAELSQYCKLPVPATLEIYDTAADKGKSVERALESGVPCPATAFPKNREEAERALSSFAFPVVIKPRKSSGSRGIRIAGNLEEFRHFYEEVEKQFPRPLIQEYIRLGTRYDVCLLFDFDSKPKASFVQKELRHFPLEMGPSTMQESIEFPELVQHALKFMEGVPWTGVIEFEFMENGPDGELIFMEANSRFWNSLYLSILCGVDFPAMLYQIVTGEEFKEVWEYRKNIRSKWLFPGDILHFLVSKNRLAMDPPLWSGKKQNVYDDTFSSEDPKPLLGLLLACFRYAFDPYMWKLMFRR